MVVKPIPDEYFSVTPYLTIQSAPDAIEFYRQVFDATELMRLTTPDGKIAHAEIKVGNATIMLADEWVDEGFLSPQRLGGSPLSLLLYVENADEQVSRALAAGATLLRPVQDQFYGDRSGTIIDPFGHIWIISTHIEDVPYEEVERRFEAELDLSQQAKAG